MTEYHFGRLIDHVHLRVADLEASKRFYSAVLDAVGSKLGGELESAFWADELFVSDDAEPTQRESTSRSRRPTARPSTGSTRRRWRPGEPTTAPRAKGRITRGYYSAYALDPDGNNVEAVFHGPARRSAASVVVTAEGE